MQRSLLFLLLGLATAPLAQTTAALQTHDGPAVAIGDGEAWAFVRTHADGTPEAIGLMLTETALDGLPAKAAMPGHEAMHMHTLALPAEAADLGLGIDHISLDWNPEGHEPEGLFTVPHFDMHFYMVPEAERRTWLPSNPEFVAKAERFPEARYLPASYVSPPDNLAIPLMGWHWFDGDDPTYAPGGPPFTEVFIWGSYDGQVIFPEPMMTRAWLQSKPDHVETLAQPEAVARTGYYPTRYSVRYDPDARRYTIALDGFVHRTAS
ncbi:DUF5602 domain-containing protein [Rubrivirga sp. IMCC45206]|uniref:DUF5602 domain-containing protein n=1 Tax=Rubrivirga sp. IMCC45206 TaxID=3391614 RepID=UPI00398FD0A8